MCDAAAVVSCGHACSKLSVLLSCVRMHAANLVWCLLLYAGARIRLMTVFSAGCYPMHTPEGYEPYTNKAAVLHLTGPDYSTPVAQVFEAAKRPEVRGALPTGGQHMHVLNGAAARLQHSAWRVLRCLQNMPVYYVQADSGMIELAAAHTVGCGRSQRAAASG